MSGERRPGSIGDESCPSRRNGGLYVSRYENLSANSWILVREGEAGYEVLDP